MNHKEVLVARYGLYTYRHRYDPVPYISNYKNTVRPYYRQPQVFNEEKQVHNSLTLIRMKRNIAAMERIMNGEPRVFDNHIRNWKRTKKKRQWM